MRAGVGANLAVLERLLEEGSREPFFGDATHVEGFRPVRIGIVGRNLPGSRCLREDGSRMEDVHVGVQVRRHPTGLVHADARQANWQIDVVVVEEDGSLDFRGPAVHGKRGGRFLYLTWVNVGRHGALEMFRRAKIMLHDVPAGLVRAAATDSGLQLVAEVDLTDERGGPRCARVDPPHLQWSLADR